MKIIKTDFHLYRNEQWFQFQTEVKKLIELYDAGHLDIRELFDAFLKIYNDADEALELIRKSGNTELLHSTDTKRDHTFRGFVDAVKSFQKHHDPEKQRMALQIQLILNHYGNIARLPNDEETATIYNFLQELRQSCSNQIDFLRLQEWLEDLENDNNEFQTLTTDRNDEQAAKTKLRMLAVRKEGDAAYRNIIERIEALILLNGDSQYSEFVNKLNNFLTHYNTIIAQRKGRNSAKKEEDKS
jgi:hypothetical protein